MSDEWGAYGDASRGWQPPAVTPPEHSGQYPPPGPPPSPYDAPPAYGGPAPFGYGPPTPGFGYPGYPWAPEPTKRGVRPIVWVALAVVIAILGLFALGAVGASVKTDEERYVARQDKVIADTFDKPADVHGGKSGSTLRARGVVIGVPARWEAGYRRIGQSVELTVGGQPARRFDYEYDDEHGDAVRARAVILIRNHKGYSATFYAEPEYFDRAVGALDVALRSWRFTD